MNILSKIPVFGWQTENCHFQFIPGNNGANRIRYREENRDKIWGYIPIVSVINGVLALLSYKADMKRTNKPLYIARAFMEIAQLGLVLLIIDAVVTIFREIQARLSKRKSLETAV